MGVASGSKCHGRIALVFAPPFLKSWLRPWYLQDYHQVCPLNHNSWHLEPTIHGVTCCLRGGGRGESKEYYNLDCNTLSTSYHKDMVYLETTLLELWCFPMSKEMVSLCQQQQSRAKSWSKPFWDTCGSPINRCGVSVLKLQATCRLE